MATRRRGGGRRLLLGFGETVRRRVSLSFRKAARGAVFVRVGEATRRHIGFGRGDAACWSLLRNHRRFARLALPARGSVGGQRGEQLCVIGPGKARTSDVFDLHLGGAVAFEVECLGDAARHVHHAVRVIGSAVVDADDHRRPVAQVGDARVARQRHGRVRGGETVAIVDLAVGGEPAVEGVAVPGRVTDLHDAAFARVVGLTGDRVGFADEILAAAVRNRLAVGDDAAAGPAVGPFRKIFLAVRGRGELLRTLGATTDAERHQDARP